VADHAVGAPLSANKSGSGRGTGLRQVVEGEIDLAMIPRRGASRAAHEHRIDYRRPFAGGLGDLGLARHSAGLSSAYTIHPARAPCRWRASML